MEDHPRHIVRNFIPLDVCKELAFIHKSNCTVGYRPNVFSTTLSHLIATNCPHLIMPFIPIRDMIKEKVEELFGCEYELFVEFTGLISWAKGSSIGWHSDDNRPYLKQRDFTAVCYLNSYEENFSGGIFHFQDGEPADYAPIVGDLVLYSADNRNVHCVDEVTEGERLTLTLWFSRNSSHDEDVKLISLLAQCTIDNLPASCIPLPASSNMYWFSSEQVSDQRKGFDIRFARLFFLGYGIWSSDGRNYLEISLTRDASEIFTEPLKLVREDNVLAKEFVNLLEALQAVYFYDWKQSSLQHFEGTKHSSDVKPLSEDEKDDVRKLERLLLSNMHLDAEIFCQSSTCKSNMPHFDWARFSVAVALWEEYILELRKQLIAHFPYWKDYRSIFSVSFSVPEQ